MRLRPTKGISIEWQELFLIVVACTLWFPHFSGKRIQFWCDDELVVAIINSGHSKDLPRFLVLLSMKHNFFVRAHHVPGVSNNITDTLSCFQDERFPQWLPRHKKTPYHPAFTNDPLTEEVRTYTKWGLAGLPTILMGQVKHVLFSFAFQTGLCPGGSLRAGHRANWPTVNTTLPGCFTSQRTSF